MVRERSQLNVGAVRAQLAHAPDVPIETARHTVAVDVWTVPIPIGSQMFTNLYNDKSIQSACGLSFENSVTLAVSYSSNELT